MSEVIGSTDFPLYIYDPEVKDDAGKPIRIIRRRETNLGNLVVDAYKTKTGADCAYRNGAGSPAFDGCEVLEMGVAEDYTIVVDYIKETIGGKIPETYKDPYGEGRITIK